MNQSIEALRQRAGPSPTRYAVRLAGLAPAYFLAARLGLEFYASVFRLRDAVCLIVVTATIAPLPAALLDPLRLAAPKARQPRAAQSVTARQS